MGKLLYDFGSISMYSFHWELFLFLFWSKKQDKKQCFGLSNEIPLLIIWRPTLLSLAASNVISLSYGIFRIVSSFCIIFNWKFLS